MNDNDNQITPPENNNGGNKRTFNEELEVAGSQLVERVKELIEEGNVRRLIIRNQEGRTLLEIPLTFGAVAGGAYCRLLDPMLAALAVIGALVRAPPVSKSSAKSRTPSFRTRRKPGATSSAKSKTSRTTSKANPFRLFSVSHRRRAVRGTPNFPALFSARSHKICGVSFSPLSACVGEGSGMRGIRMIYETKHLVQP